MSLFVVILLSFAQLVHAYGGKAVVGRVLVSCQAKASKGR